MDSDKDSWIEHLQKDLEALPKHSYMIAKSKIFKMTLNETGREMMKKKLESQLYYLWDLCHITKTQRNAFNFLVNRLYNDKEGKTSLAFYDIEVEKLWHHYENNKEIFKALDLYKEQVTRMNNSNDFERKIIFGSILDTEKRLKELDKKYEDKMKENFYTWGKTIPEYINQQLLINRNNSNV